MPVVGRPAHRDDVDRQLAADAEILAGRRWIWAYHAPPDASPTSWTGKRHYGDEDLGRWIERTPPTSCCAGTCTSRRSRPPADGSTASAPPWWSTPGSQPGPEPTRIEIDTDADVAAWWSYLGVDEQALAA